MPCFGMTVKRQPTVRAKRYWVKLAESGPAHAPKAVASPKVPSPWPSSTDLMEGGGNAVSCRDFSLNSSDLCAGRCYRPPQPLIPSLTTLRQEVGGD